MMIETERLMQQRIRYYIERLKELRPELTYIYNEVKPINERECKENTFSVQCMVSQFYLAITNRLIQIISAIESVNPYSTLLTTRYVLELLVHLKFLEKDHNYIYCIHAEQIKQHIEFIRKQIEKIKREIKVLEQLDETEHEIDNILMTLLEKLRKELDKSNELKGRVIHELLSLLPRTFMKAVDRLAEKKFLLYSEDAKYMGYGFMAYLLQEKILPKYEEKLKELQNYKDKFYNYVKSINIHLDSLCSNKNIPRSWSKKSDMVGLKEDYDIIYFYTSNILHATPTSIMHEKILESAEVYMFVRYLYARICDIIELIRNGIAKLKRGKAL